MTETSYNPVLVALSIVIAIFASYTALDLGNRVRGAAPAARWGWVAGASLAMGGGIWSMHFIGMLAFDMAMPVAYGVGLTVGSFLIAVGATGAAFAWVSRPGANPRNVFVSGPLMGLGVAAMHYTGMAAMRIPGRLTYSLPVVAVSVLIAVTAATVALWLTFRQNDVWQKLLAAGVMGLAVAGMHYVGMAAATFSGGLQGAMPDGGDAVDQQNLALYVAGATFLILFLAMLASSVDQQRTQGALRASEERFRAAAEAVGDVIWTNDARGEMRGPQPDWSKFTGQSQAEYEGFGWSQAVHPDDVGSTIATWNRAVAGRHTFVYEHRVRRHDGVYRLFSVRAVPLLANGVIREWVGVHEDITDRREFEGTLRLARDEAMEANLAKSTFLANMSHELRTPLSAIIGYSEMMAEEIADGCAAADLAADMVKVETNARHLLGLINDMLDLSKVESGKMEVFVESFAIEPMVRELATTVGSLVAKKGNRLDLRLATDLGAMSSDLTKVKQVLLNLLSNAAKFTERGAITLAVSRESRPLGDRVLFRVSDTGIGMTEEQLAKLFQRFQQADASTTRRFGGTGLGLSLTKAFADLLGGVVSVESVPGEGSSFTLDLPAALATPVAPDDDAGEASGPDGGAELVLVIDDDADQRELMRRFLGREGFQARVAADGETGLAMARALKPRAILLDVMMPGIDGWSVLSALKRDESLAGIPVIMVTFVEQRALAASLGAADYVLKPVRWDRFKAVMDRFRPAVHDVLLVDDDRDTRTRIRASLERDGWAVAEAENGSDALARLESHTPGLVLLDLTMPVMDGFEFLERMRARSDCADVPVVVLTARDLSREDRRRLQGASQILNKGEVSMHALAERLQGFAVERAA